jgi:hypothetical protein
MVPEREGQCMRYTDEQRNLAEGMEILIKLYYRLKETDKKDWLSEPVVRLIAEIVYKVIPGFTTCLYLKNPDNKNTLRYFTGAPGYFLN